MVITIHLKCKTKKDLVLLLIEIGKTKIITNKDIYDEFWQDIQHIDLDHVVSQALHKYEFYIESCEITWKQNMA